MPLNGFRHEVCEQTDFHLSFIHKIYAHFMKPANTACMVLTCLDPSFWL